MKTKMTISFIIFFIMTITISICQNNTINTANRQVKEVYSEEKILSMLKEFYTSYITEYSKIASVENTKPVIERLNSIKIKYCTTRLLTKIENEELDADPFLKSQDFNIEWLKTLKFKKDSKRLNLYIASYSYYDHYKHTNNQITIKLIIIKQQGYYKINSVW